MHRIEDTCHYHIIAGNRHINYEITELNLTVIITLAFVIATPEAGILRKWLIEQFSKMYQLNVILRKWLIEQFSKMYQLNVMATIIDENFLLN